MFIYEILCMYSVFIFFNSSSIDISKFFRLSHWVYWTQVVVGVVEQDVACHVVYHVVTAEVAVLSPDQLLC
jgi:hypothetical protein